MGDIRKTITNEYENLRQLENYERLLEYLSDEGRNQWWKIVTPNKETNISTSRARENFMDFIADEISRIKRMLGIND